MIRMQLHSSSTAAKPESFDCDDHPLFQELARTVIECAAEGYGVDGSEITLDTDIRLDLSNESMKMIAMIAGIEEELDVTVDIQEAGNLNTIREFVLAVKEKNVNQNPLKHKPNPKKACNPQVFFRFCTELFFVFIKTYPAEIA